MSQPSNHGMNQRDQNDQTPLHTTAEKGATDVVRLYVKMGADVAALDKYRQTPLHLAAGNGHFSTVEALLELDDGVRELRTLQDQRATIYPEVFDEIRAQLEADNDVRKDATWKTVDKLRAKLFNLTTAIPSQTTNLPKASDKLREWLIQLFNDLTKMTKHDGVQLYEMDTLLAQSQCDQVRQALGAFPRYLGCLASIYVRGRDGRTALHCAAEKKGNEEVIRLLLENGASVNTFDQNRAALPQWAEILEFGVENKHNKMVQLLLDQGVDNMKDEADYGQRTLGMAAAKKNLCIVELLIRDGADFNTENGQRALMLILESAKSAKRECLLDDVIKRGANIDAALCIAVEKGWSSVVKLLVAKGARIHADNGAISVAVEKKRWEMVRELVQGDALVNAGVNVGMLLVQVLDTYHQTKLENPCECEASFLQVPCCCEINVSLGMLKDIADTLVKRVGKDIDKAKKDGKTALHLAVRACLWEIVSQLVEKGADTGLARDMVESGDDSMRRYDEAVKKGYEGRGSGA